MGIQHIPFLRRLAGGVSAGLLYAAAATAGTVTVGDYAALTNAIAVCADGDTISITNTITVSAEVLVSSKGLTLEGNQHTIRVPVPSLAESGIVNASPSAFRVFHISSAGRTNTFRNLTVKGGSPAGDGGGILNNSGTLILEGVTVTQSGCSTYGGGGVANTAGTLFMRDCAITLNTANNGGGFVNFGAGAKMFIERCSLSENRCMNGWGGGAGENKAWLYVNNSTFANNESIELGGAINNYMGTAYFIGCTFVSNMAYGSAAGGALVNHDGTVTLVSSLFAYNYHNSSGTYVLDDIFNYNGAAPLAYGCVFQSTTNQLGVGSVGTTLYPGNAAGTDDTLFAGGAATRVRAADGTETGAATFYLPYLARVGSSQAPTTVLRSGSFAMGKGVRTSFSSATATPVVGYYNGSAWVDLSGSNSACHEVTLDQNGVARGDLKTVGAVGLPLVAPVIALPPTNQVQAAGKAIGLSASATGTAPLAYQWFKNGGLVSGATNSTLAWSSAAVTDSGTYYVAITNAYGMCISTPVTVTVGSPRLYTWGSSNYGQLGDGFSDRSYAVAVASNVVVAAAGNLHSLFIRGDGLLWAMGEGWSGQMGDGFFVRRTNPMPVTSNVVAAAGGKDHSLFVKGDGTLWAMGDNKWGQLGDGTANAHSNAVPVASNVVAVSGGFYHSLFLKGDGTLWAMGQNTYGQLGDGTTNSRSRAVCMASNVTALAAGGYHSLFMKGDGTLWAMGQNTHGQLGDGTTTNRHFPVSVDTHVAALAAGFSHSLHLKGDGTLWAMGQNTYGQLGDGTTNNRTRSVCMASNVTALSAGNLHSLFIRGDGTAWAMGYNYQGQLGDRTWSDRHSPVPVSGGLSLAAVVSCSTAYHTLAVGVPPSGPVIATSPTNQVTAVGGALCLSSSATGTAPLRYQWFKNGGRVSGATNSTLMRTGAAVTDSGVYYVVITNAHGMSISTPATVAVGAPHLLAWGWNAYGQLGDGTTTNRHRPVIVASDAVAASAGESHSLFVKADGTLWATGFNANGELGDGTTDTRHLPVRVDSNVVAVAAGARHSLFLKRDGTLWAMGSNADGQLGDGTTTTQHAPICVASNVVAVAAGAQHSLFLKGDGTLWAMGQNSLGQLGDGTTTTRHAPISVASTVVAVTAGTSHSLFLKSDGTLWAMGYNHFGQLGDGTTVDRHSPVAVASPVTAWAVGVAHSLYLTEDGTLWAMGVNRNGQLGDGSTASRSNAVAVASNVTALAAGGSHSLYLKGDGTLWATGDNNWGQLGDGTTTDRLSPVSVSGMSLASLFSGSSVGHALAVGEPLPLTFMGQPIAQAAEVGSNVTFTVEAAGFAPLSYQWYFNGGAIGGATATNYTLANVTAANAGNYTVVVSNPNGSVTSGVAVLTVLSPPSITLAPTNQVLAIGGTIALSVTATSVVSQHFQWFKNGGMVSGATNSALTRVGAAVTDSGVYCVAITNAYGLSISTPVTVAVGSPQVLAWGWNYYGQLGDGTTTNRPRPVAVASAVVSAAAGNDHSLFVKADSTLWATGFNGDGELGDGTVTTRHLPVRVDSNVVTVAAGAWHSLYLKREGTLWAMGQNLSGQLGDGTTAFRHSPVPVASQVMALSAGSDFSVYLKSDGTLWAMGLNTSGQLGDGTTSARSNAVCVASHVVAMTTGSRHTLFLKGDGTLWAMGRNADGQLGDGTLVDRHSPVAVASHVTALAAGASHSLYVKNDGTLWAMGVNGNGQLGDGSMASRSNAVSVASNVTALAAGLWHSLYVKGDGTVWAMGQNVSGQLGDGTATQRITPVSVPGMSLANVVSGNGASHTLGIGAPLPLTITGKPLSQTAVAGSNVTFTVAATGFAPLSYHWYFNGDAISGATSTNLILAAVTPANAGSYMAVVSNPDGSVTSGVAVLTVLERPIITTAPTNHVVAVGGPIHLSCTATGVLPLTYQWFKNGAMVSGATNSAMTQSTAVVTDSGVYYVAITNAFGLSITTPVTVTVGNPQLMVWGYNNSGQLGDGTTTTRSNPVSVASNVVAASAGGLHSLFVRGDGTLWAMGEGLRGQLGVWPSNSRSNAVSVATHVVAVAGGYEHSLFVKADSTLWAMGFNLAGQLGDGTLTERITPVSVASNVVSVVAGSAHSLFLKDDGTLWTMGFNNYGQLGDGTTINRSHAVCVASNVVSMAAGAWFSLFLKSDGTLWGMGFNYSGQLGDGTWTTSQSNAVFVASDVVSMAAGNSHSLFLTGDGTLWGMGSTFEGQLGRGTWGAWNTPIALASNVTDMAAGAWHSLVLKGDGSLWAMGQGTEGQLGDGTSTSRLSPVSVPGMSLASFVSGSSAGHTLAVGVPLPPLITSQPTSQTAGFGSNATLSVTATGFAPLAYQWYFNDGAISGATSTNYTLTGMTTANSGNYTVVVSSPGGSVTSGVAVLTFAKALASVTLDGLIQTCDGMPKSVTALTVPSGLTVLMTYNGLDTAPTAVGTYAVTGTVSDANWQGSASGTLIVKASQSIDFEVLAPQPLTRTVRLAATASSGLPVSFSVLSGPGTITDGTNLTFSAAGIVVVAASQAGDASYGAAPDVTRRIFVYTVIPDNGPFQGGNAVTLNSGSPGMITNVQVGGVSAGIQSVGPDGLTLTVPASGTSGVKDIVVQTSDNGDFTLTHAYTVNPAGWIGGSKLEPSGWEGFGSGLSGSSVSALALDGTNLYAGGDFTSAGGASASRVALWNGTGWTNLGSGLSGTAVYALAHDGANLYAGGDFTNAGGMAANSVAMWSGTVWTGLGSGLSGTVRALAHDGVNLYAGGTFTNAGGVAANYVAMWDGANWTALGNGVGSWVRALAHDGTSLYAGGYFTTAGGVEANHVARWNGTSWEALGNGLNNDVRALTVVGQNLVAGGDFTAAGNGAANAVALWDGTGWTALGSGMNDSVTALAYDGVHLAAGGYFTAAGGVGANYVALWNGVDWTALGSGMNGAVKALAHDGTDLYAGGDFTAAGGVPVGRAAVWGETLVGLSGVAPASGARSGGYTVTISGANLCDGSDVTGVTLCGISATVESQSATQIVVTAGIAGSTGLGDVRVYSTRFGETVRPNAFTYLANQTVSFAALAPQPLAAQVGLAATASSGLPVSFRVVSGPGTITDGTNLTFSAAGLVTIAASQAGDALYGAAPDVVNSVHVYTVVPDNGPFAGGNTVALNIGTLGTVKGVQVAGAAAAVQGIDASGLTFAMPAIGSAGVKEIVVQTSDHGDFTLAGAYTVNPAGQIGGSVTGPNIWTDLGGGLPGSAVYALAHAGTNLFAGGTFTLAGGAAANDAMWDGIDWSALGGGMDDTVTALAYDGDHLYAGGYFTTAGGVAANYVAMWDGASWTALGSGLDGPVSALVCDGGNLYAGGAFTTAGGIAANRVAKWTGTYWTGLGSGVEGSSVMALAHDGTNLYAGGDFTKAGGVTANRLARWNGAAWSRLGSGLNGTVFALELDGAGLVAGGAFTAAGGVSANRVALWNGTSWSGLGSGMNDTVRALAHHGPNLFAGGYFTAAGGAAANYVAQWNGTGWTNLASGVNSWVRALEHDGNSLYAGGYFTAAGGAAANHVASWTPSVITYANVTPDSGALAGGYTVVISGANLCSGADVTNVTLCGVSAAVQSQSATQIVVTVGAAVTLGPGDVRVFSTRFGETVKADAFTYLASPVWNPQVQSGESFGVRSNGFGFTITGSSNLIVVVEACTNMADPVWAPLETNMLTDGQFDFSDPVWTNYPARFYRLRQP